MKWGTPNLFSNPRYGHGAVTSPDLHVFAWGLLTAAKIIEDGLLSDFVRERYSSWDSASGKQVMSGQSSFAELEKFVLENGEPILRSGRQEYLENIINSYIWFQWCFLLLEQSDSLPDRRKHVVFIIDMELLFCLVINWVW